MRREGLAGWNRFADSLVFSGFAVELGAGSRNGMLDHEGDVDDAEIVSLIGLLQVDTEKSAFTRSSKRRKCEAISTMGCEAWERIWR